MNEPYILFELAGTTYGIKGTNVQQIEMLETITHVPGAPEYIEGIMFSRGQVIPVINLRKRFGFKTAEPDIKTRVIVVQSEGRTVGLLVDTAREFISFSQESIQPAPETISGLSGNYLKGIAKIDKRIILIIDINEIIKIDELQLNVNENN